MNNKKTNNISTILEAYEKSELAQRINGVEGIALIHGFNEYHGQTVQDFLRTSLTSLLEEMEVEEMKNTRDDWENDFDRGCSAGSLIGYNLCRDQYNEIKRKLKE